jgi:hypothetical protein
MREVGGGRSHARCHGCILLVTCFCVLCCLRRT